MMQSTEQPIAHEGAIDYLRMLDRCGFIALPAVEAPRIDEPALAPAKPSPPAGGEATLTSVAEEIAQCKRCGLCETRNKTVPGEGSPEAKLVFVGEGPGAAEDRQGRPFVGRAGDLLTQMIQAMKFRREDVFICNVVRCRPPGNRDPEPREVQACKDYLLRQLDLLQPKIIVALGRIAAQCLLETKTPIGRMRGQWREYNGIRLMPTFHPAYLLRSPGEKGKCWEDLQEVMAEYERTVGPLPRA